MYKDVANAVKDIEQLEFLRGQLGGEASDCRIFLTASFMVYLLSYGL